MLEECDYERNNSNNKVKLGRGTKFFEFLVHYSIYKEKCARKKSIKIKKIEMLFSK